MGTMTPKKEDSTTVEFLEKRRPMIHIQRPVHMTYRRVPPYRPLIVPPGKVRIPPHELSEVERFLDIDFTLLAVITKLEPLKVHRLFWQAGSMAVARSNSYASISRGLDAQSRVNTIRL